jgi:hypothetical protein
LFHKVYKKMSDDLFNLDNLGPSPNIRPLISTATKSKARTGTTTTTSTTSKSTVPTTTTTNTATTATTTTTLNSKSSISQQPITTTITTPLSQQQQLTQRSPPCFHNTKPITDPAPLAPSERLDYWRHSLNLSADSPRSRSRSNSSNGNINQQQQQTNNLLSTINEYPPSLVECISRICSSSSSPSVDEKSHSKSTSYIYLQRMHELWGAFSPLAFDNQTTITGNNTLPVVTVTTPRTQSLLQCLLAFHDPLLMVFFQSNNITTWYGRSDLFQMYVDVPRLLDLAILSGVAGFDTPQLGSFFFALGLLVSHRIQIMSIQPATDETINQYITKEIVQKCRNTLCDNEELIELAIAVGSRAASATPSYFLRLLGEVEMITLQDYCQRASDYIQLQILANKQKAISNNNNNMISSTTNNTQSSTAANNNNANTWWNKVVNNIVPSTPTTTSSNTKTATATTTSTTTTDNITQLLKRTIPAATANTPIKKNQPPPRRLYAVEYKGERKLGIKLVAGKDGLAVKEFDHHDGTIGEAEEDGSVQIGDLMHAVNGVSVILLTSKMAGKVIQAQERPLHIVFSTIVNGNNSSHGSRIPPKLSPDLLKEQKSLLHARLFAFYGRQGGGDKQNRVDDLLRLFAGKEIGFLRALSNKYGEKVPGDPTLQPVLVMCDPKEIVESLLRLSDQTNHTPLDLDAVFVDARPQAERIDTGTFEASFLIGPDELAEKTTSNSSNSSTNNPGSLNNKHLNVLTTHISKLKSKHTKIHLLSSGKARLSWMTEPNKAKLEQQAEDEFIVKLAKLLWARGVYHVDVVQGGFVSVFREIKIRKLDHVRWDNSNPNIPGKIRLGSEALAKVDFEDAKSVTTFIMGYFNDFVPSSIGTGIVVGGSTTSLGSSTTAGSEEDLEQQQHQQNTGNSGNGKLTLTTMSSSIRNNVSKDTTNTTTVTQLPNTVWGGGLNVALGGKTNTSTITTATAAPPTGNTTLRRSNSGQQQQQQSGSNGNHVNTNGTTTVISNSGNLTKKLSGSSTKGGPVSTKSPSPPPPQPPSAVPTSIHSSTSTSSQIAKNNNPTTNKSQQQPSKIKNQIVEEEEDDAFAIE